jgi:hypothetical protein
MDTIKKFAVLLILISAFLAMSCEYDPENPGNCMSYAATIFNVECDCELSTEKSCKRNVELTEDQYYCLKKALDTSPGLCLYFESLSCLPGEAPGFLTSVVAFQNFYQELTCIN